MPFVYKLVLAAVIGFVTHFGRPFIARHVPRRRGWFPLACYFVGGLLIIGVDALLYGGRHARKTAVAFVAVGGGVAAGWAVDCFAMERKGKRPYFINKN